MNLGEFHQFIADDINRGDSLTATIPVVTRMAARFIENNYTLQYMRRFVSFTMDASAAVPNCLPLPGEPKSFGFFRLIPTGASEYHYLNKIDPRDSKIIEDGLPDAYWVDGVDNFILDRSPDVDYPSELYYAQYTTWPTADSALPWLLANAEAVMIAQTMKLMVPVAKVPVLAKSYETLGTEGIRALLIADEELQRSGASVKMRYGKVY